MRKLEKKCVVCSKKLKIIITDVKGHYRGGNYFGKMKLYKKHRYTNKIWRFGKFNARIVVGIGKPKVVEYWECARCFRE